MRVAAILRPLEDVPVDFLADPDGAWEFESLASAAGFDEAWGQISIGALTQPYLGFPEGAAVVLLSAPEDSAIALIDCTAPARSAANRAASLSAASLRSASSSSESPSSGWTEESFSTSVAA